MAIDYGKPSKNEQFKFAGDGQTLDAKQSSILVAGKYGTTAKFLNTDVDGNLLVNIGGSSINLNGDVIVSMAADANAVGFDSYFNSSADNTKTSIKASTGNLYQLTCDNPNVTRIYVQLFNKALADITVGTTVPNYVIPVLPGAMFDNSYAIPMEFSTAISYAVTTTSTGAVAPSTAVMLSAGYK